MNKCTFCGRESESHKTKFVGGHGILECCTDCEAEILEGQLEYENDFGNESLENNPKSQTDN
ncbi:MAG: hypothetical protein WC725_05000 [Patescibacteria group bacterium]|jgi:hypothetical protein